MKSIESVNRQIVAAFEKAEFPGDTRLVDSDQGSEPGRVERDFRGKKDWRKLDPTFIDQSPDELATALTFFSNAAFRFYLPAFLLADLAGQLRWANPTYQLTHYFSKEIGDKIISAKDAKGATWREFGDDRFSGFTQEQVKAIIAYLEIKEAGAPPFDKPAIQQALDTYWRRRAAS